MPMNENKTVVDEEKQGLCSGLTEDKEIIKLYLSRDEEAISVTKRKYGKQIFFLARHLLGSAEEAEECQNDTLLKAWNTIPPFIPNNLKAYLMRVCRSLACDRIDWKRAKKRDAELVAITEELENCLPDSRTVDDGKEIREAIEGFLRKEEKENRIIFVRRYWYAQTTEEIARYMGKKASNVRVILHRMRKRLKEYLEKEGIDI